MIKVASLFLIFFCLIFAAGSQAREPDFRLIYIGSLSGYVKLCG